MVKKKRECPRCGGRIKGVQGLCRACWLYDAQVGLRFLERVVAANEQRCVDWPFSSVNPQGYGTLKVGGKVRPATHVSLELDGRSRPASPNDNALHSCDRPPCVNPRHLRWGSKRENMEDAISRGQYKVGAEHHNARR